MNPQFSITGILNNTKTVVGLLVFLILLSMWTQKQVDTRDSQLDLIRKDIYAIKTNDIDHVQGALDTNAEEVSALRLEMREQRDRLIRIEVLLQQILEER